MNDLPLIKEEIYNCGYIVPLLEDLGCDCVEMKSDRVEAMRPGGNNKRSVQVKLNKNLSSSIRSKSHLPITDIYDLVSYIKFGKETSEEFKDNLPRSKKYILETLGLSGFEYNKTNKDDPNAWLKEIQNKRKKRIDLDAIEPNPVLPESVLNEFVMLPHIKWINDGVDYRTQQTFEVGFDLATERIVFIIRNKLGQIVGVKGRATRERDKKDYKYMPIYSFQKSQELYNLHRSLSYILERNEIILWESEKSCQKSHQFEIYHTVSQMGSDITKIQAEIIKRLSPDIKIILAYDKDKSVEEIRKMSQVFGGYDNLYAIVDTKNLLSNGEAPIDKGKETFETLYNNHCYKIK